MITGVQKMMMMVLSMKMATQMAQMLETIFTRMKMIVQKFIGELDLMDWTRYHVELMMFDMRVQLQF